MAVVRCACCGAEIDLSGAIPTVNTPAGPKWGDLILCPACNGPNIFTARLQLRRLNPGERETLNPLARAVLDTLTGKTQRAPLQ